MTTITFGPFDYNTGRKIWYELVNNDDYWKNAMFKVDVGETFFIHLYGDSLKVTQENIIKNIINVDLTAEEIGEVDEFFDDYNDYNDTKVGGNKVCDNIQSVYHDLRNQGYSHSDIIFGHVYTFLKDFSELLFVVYYGKNSRKIDYNIVEYMLRLQNIPTDMRYSKELIRTNVKQSLVRQYLGVFDMDDSTLELLCNSIEHIIHKHVYVVECAMKHVSVPFKQTTLENTVKVSNDVYRRLLTSEDEGKREQVERVVEIAKQLPIPTTFKQLSDVLSRNTDKLEKMTDKEIYDDVVDSIKFHIQRYKNKKNIWF